MTAAVIFLSLVVALIAKMIYDVQVYMAEKLERARLQILAGIEVDEELAKRLRTQRKRSQEKLKKEAQKTAKDKSDEVLPLAQTAAEEIVAVLTRSQQLDSKKQKV